MIELFHICIWIGINILPWNINPSPAGHVESGEGAMETARNPGLTPFMESPEGNHLFRPIEHVRCFQPTLSKRSKFYSWK